MARVNWLLSARFTLSLNDLDSVGGLNWMFSMTPLSVVPVF